MKSKSKKSKIKSEKIPKVKVKGKAWHHDIKMIDGRWIEDVVDEYQKTPESDHKEELLCKIIDNYSIFRNKWALDFAKQGIDVESGKLLHDEIVWRAARKFDITKAEKEKGRAFNAFLVATQCNYQRNLNNTKTSKKNHPRVTCPICEEEIYQIDAKHLRHETDSSMYEKLFPDYPLVSYDGTVGKKKQKVEDNKYYTLEIFNKEHAAILPKFPVECPMSRQMLTKVTTEYPSMLIKGYTEADFINDFPDFAGIITCPFSGAKKLEITQAYLDEVLKQTQATSDQPKVRQVKVTNPYTGQLVDEITLEMLQAAGTDLRTHVYRFPTIELNVKYKLPIECPITGQKVKKISTKRIEKLGYSEWEFYMATCKYPLRKYQVRSAYDDKWVDNIWTHLSKKIHTYAKPYTMDDFDREYSNAVKRAFVSTNCYFESDSGDQMHISDLFVTEKNENDMLEIQDSLMSMAQDELDVAIITSIRDAHTVEDLYYHSSISKEITLDLSSKPSTKELKSEIKKIVGISDFDITKSATEHPKSKDSVTIMIPSRDTIRKRLHRMLQASDIK